MITIRFLDYHIELPYPAVSLQLVTAIRLGLDRIRQQDANIRFKALQVRMNGNKIMPADASTEVPDNALISLIPIHAEKPDKDKYFMLE